MSRENFVAKAASVFVALAMVMGVYAVAPTGAQAQTTAELEAQIQSLLATIAALQAQIGGLQGGATGLDCPVGGFNVDLTVGASGAAVLELQQFLNSVPGVQVAVSGPGAPGSETTYFGPATRGAVVMFQEKYASEVLAPVGLVAGTGYWGSSSRAKANALCTAPVPTPDDDDDDVPADDDDDDDDLDGEEGSMTVTRGSASSAVVDLGDEEDIYSIEIEANDSDMEVSRIDLMFDARPWLYIDEIMLTVDGEEIASNDDIDEATEVGTEWRLRFTGLDLVVEEDDEVEVVFWAITPDSLPGTRASDTVSVHVPDDGVRATDGAGLIHYEPSGDLSSRSFSFDENFGLGEIEVREDDASPETGIIVVSSTTETNNVEVMLFDVEADDGDATVEEIYVSATTTTLDKPDDVVSEICLYHGTTEIDCATFSEASSAISNRGAATGIAADEYFALFDDLELEIEADETEDFSLKASFNEADGTNYSGGETIIFTLEQVAGFNEDFENTSDEVTIGSGETFTLLTEGIFIDNGDASVSGQVDPGSDGGNDQYRTFTIEFDVTAVEEDAFIFNSAGTTSTSGVQFDIFQDGSDVTSSFSGTTSASLSSTADLQTNAYKVSKGQTETFTLSVTLDPATTADYAVELDKVEFDQTDNATEIDYTEVQVANEPEFQTSPARIDNAA